MKFHHLSCAALLLAATALSSCIGDEPANAECDIQRAWVQLSDPSSIFYHRADAEATILPSYASSDIQFPEARHDAVITTLPLYVEVTPGAQIFLLTDDSEQPFRSGDPVDFSNDRVQRFRVRSADGNYMREYTMSIKHAAPPTVSTETLQLGSLSVSGLTLSDNTFSATQPQRIDIAPFGEIPVTVQGTRTGDELTFTLDVEMSSQSSAHLTFSDGQLTGMWDDKELLPTDFSPVLTDNGDGTATLTLNELSINTATLIHFDFEDDALDEKGIYCVWNEPANPGITWATGNPGFQLSRSSATRDEYPSVAEDGGVDGGRCVRLTTSSTGSFGSMVGMPIAAGNLFTGTFDVGNALRDALAATLMGQPYPHKPLYMRGYYKFKPGAANQDRRQHPLAEPDVCDFYCFVYKNTDEAGNNVQLDGNILDTDKANNPYVDNIVGRARIASADIDRSGEEWVTFNLPVVYSQDISREDVLNRQYSVAVVFSSSAGGAYFNGAVGSTLWIDNVTLVCEY